MKPGFKKKKKCRLQKTLRNSSKVEKGTKSHHFRVFGPKEELYMITRNLGKNGELLL